MAFSTSYGGWYPQDHWTYTGSFSTTTSNVMTFPTMAIAAVPAAAPKRSALEWLDAETEQVCALARKVAA